MWRRKKDHQKIKLKASSLIELIIAMVIITIVMMLGFTIFLNLKFSSISMTKINAKELAESQCTFVREQGAFVNDEEQKGHLMVVTSCENYNSELMEVTISIQSPDGRIFHEIKELIRSK